MVGSSQGSVHRQRQGTGLATILSGDLAVKDFLAQDDLEAKTRMSGLAARQKAAQDAADNIAKFNPERWLRHEREIKDGMNAWVDQGAKLMRQGKNPWSSTDDESVAWRKQQATLDAKAKASMQMKEMFEATRSKIDGSEPTKYDPASLQAMRDYFETPLDQIISGAVLPPALLQARPSMDLQKTWAGLAKDLYDRNGDKPLDEAGKWDFVTASIGNDPQLLEAAGSYMANLPAGEQERYKQRSQQTGKSIMELVNRDFLDRYSPGKEPFDLNKYIQQGADSIDVPYSSWRNPETFGKSVDKKELAGIARTKAQTMLTNPDALIGYQSLLPMKDGETEGEYRARAVPDLAKRLQNMKATSTESGLTDKGGEGRDIQVSGEMWLRHIKSADTSLNERASRFLFDTKGLIGNINVESAKVDPTMIYDDQLKKAAPSLIIYIQGNPSLKEVEKAITENTDFKKDQIRFETVGTSSVVRIPITDDTENALLRMHDKAFKTGNRKYDPTPLDWSADDILKTGKPAPAAAQKVRF